MRGIFKKITLSLILIIPIIVGIIFIIRDKPTINIPNKIVIYNNGKSQEIERTNQDFEKIVYLSNILIDNSQNRLQYDIKDNSKVNEDKKNYMSIELIYKNPQNIKTKEKTITYNTLNYSIYNNNIDSYSENSITYGINTAFGIDKQFNYYEVGNVKPYYDLQDIIENYIK